MDADAILADWRSLRILAVAQKPMAARQISDESGVPIAPAYRRINALRRSGFLRVAFVRHGAGSGSMRMYISTISRVVVSFLGGAPKIQVVPRIAVEFASDWR